jgi:shikimate kinase
MDPDSPSPKSPRQNVVLIGFMGTGKSTIGDRVAQALGFMFVDTDSIIEQTAKQTIPNIFANNGEADFRRRESAALRSLRDGERLVISTGGGIFTIPENVTIVQELGFVIWLNATEEVIFERVSKNQNRPLLKSPNPRETIHEVLEQRRSVYQSCADLEIDTTDLTEDEVAFGICESARVKWG